MFMSMGQQRQDLPPPPISTVSIAMGWWWNRCPVNMEACLYFCDEYVFGFLKNPDTGKCVKP